MMIKIGSRLVGEGQPCFIIAEAGVNHNGNMDLAYELIDEACRTGVDAIKFQTFLSEKIITPDARRAEYQAANIGGEETQYQMLKRLEISYGQTRELKKYCDSKGIIFLSTPHSCNEDIDLIAELCPAIKIASGDAINLPFLKYAAEKGLPIILATGMSTMNEVREAVDAIKSINSELMLLHCTTNYPTPLNEVNLKAMLSMKKEFGLTVGYSDHTMGIKVSAAAVALGAKVIEKHFTLDRNMPGPDHKASLEPYELEEMVREIRETEKRISKGESADDIISELGVYEALGDGIKKPTSSEMKIMMGIRKSIHADSDIRKGEKITESNITIKRPFDGMLPKYYWSILGKRVNKNMKKDEPIREADLE